MEVTCRALNDNTARMGIVECVNHTLAVHYKFTVLLVPNGTDRITGNVIDKAAYPSEKKCEDEKILEVMKFAAMKKKSKKAKKAKKTEA